MGWATIFGSLSDKCLERMFAGYRLYESHSSQDSRFGVMPYAGAVAGKDFATCRGGHEDCDCCTYRAALLERTLPFSLFVISTCALFFVRISGEGTCGKRVKDNR